MKPQSLILPFLIVCLVLHLSQAARPNIILIFSDDHATQAVSAYGGRLAEVAPTPNIDRLAAEGMRFERCYVTNSICAPSRAVVLTGKYSHLNGVRDNTTEFDGSQDTFPKRLQSAGYATALIGKWHLRSEPTGFDHWEILPGQGSYYNPDFITVKGRHREEGHVTELIFEKAVAWLAEQDGGDPPFMLMVQPKAPHREWSPPPDKLTLYHDTVFPEPANLFDNYGGRGTAAREQDLNIAQSMRLGHDNKMHYDEHLLERDARWRQRLTPAQLEAWDAVYRPISDARIELGLEGDALTRWKYQRYLQDYLACVRGIDEGVGRLLDALDAQGLAENTIVLYSSDQGFFLGEHGWFDKRFMYEESLRAPLLVRWRGEIEPGQIESRIVSNLDFAPTFLELAGADISDEMQGISLLPLLKGAEASSWRDSFYYRYYEYPRAHAVHPHDGVVSERYKLIAFHTLGEYELYDRELDPHEMRSVYEDPRYNETREELLRKLTRMRSEYRDAAFPVE